MHFSGQDFTSPGKKGSHITLRRDDPKARVTVPNHKALKKGLLRCILKDAELTVEQFTELLNE